MNSFLITLLAFLIFKTRIRQIEGQKEGLTNFSSLETDLQGILGTLYDKGYQPQYIEEDISDNEKLDGEYLEFPDFNNSQESPSLLNQPSWLNFQKEVFFPPESEYRNIIAHKNEKSHDKVAPIADSMWRDAQSNPFNPEEIRYKIDKAHEKVAPIAASIWTDEHLNPFNPEEIREKDDKTHEKVAPIAASIWTDEHLNPFNPEEIREKDDKTHEKVAPIAASIWNDEPFNPEEIGDKNDKSQDKVVPISASKWTEEQLNLFDPEEIREDLLVKLREAELNSKSNSTQNSTTLEFLLPIPGSENNITKTGKNEKSGGKEIVSNATKAINSNSKMLLESNISVTPMEQGQMMGIPVKELDTHFGKDGNNKNIEDHAFTDKQATQAVQQSSVPITPTEAPERGRFSLGSIGGITSNIIQQTERNNINSKSEVKSGTTISSSTDNQQLKKKKFSIISLFHKKNQKQNVTVIDSKGPQESPQTKKGKPTNLQELYERLIDEENSYASRGQNMAEEDITQDLLRNVRPQENKMHHLDQFYDQDFIILGNKS